MRSSAISILALSAMLLILGCSGNRNPIIPGESLDSPSVSQNNKSYPGVLGAWKVLLDPKNMTAEITPARNAAKIGDYFDADLSQFLTVSPCSNCLQITGISKALDNNIHLNVMMRHPFTNKTSRPDLHGFDVRAIFIVPRQYYASIPMKVTKLDGTQEDAKISYGYILNPDGYTSHFDELIDDSRYFLKSEDAPTNLNPYLRFFETWSMGTFDPQNPTGYNVMPVGQNTYQRTVVFTGGVTDTIGIYIVADVAYGQSAVLANRTNPQYYLPAFNRTEPWRMEYWLENNNLAYDDANSTADLIVQVFDWQHSATVDPAFPNPANLSGLRESSKVASLEVYFPSMMSAPVVATIPESGNGTPSSPLQYKMQIRNELLYLSSQVTGFIAIRDQLDGAAAPSGPKPIPESPSGFPYATNDIRDYSYYGIINVNIPNQYYVNEYNGELYVDKKTLFDSWGTNINCQFFMDNSRKMFQYRWDFDYDGVTFDNDGGGIPSPYLDLSTPGKRNIALRVRTNSVPPREYIYQMAAYGPGFADKERIDNSGVNDSTSEMRTQAVALVNDIFYIAYVGKYEDIYLARYKAGELLGTTQITTDSQNSEPSITVIPTGAHAGVYIAWVENEGAPQIQSNWVNLDGSGFSHTNERTVPFTQAQYRPCLLYKDDTLFMVFQETAPSYSRIASFLSTDYAQSWGDHKFIENTATKQYNPAVTMDIWNRFNVVWEDKRDDGTLGIDLYMGYSDDGLYWWGSRNVLNTTRNIDEFSPSISHKSSKTAIVYLSQINGDPNADLRFHVIGYSGDIDMRLEYTSGSQTCTSPSVAQVLTNSYQMFYLVSYGIYDTSAHTLQSKTYCYTDRNGWDIFNDIFHLSEDLGTVNALAGAGTYAGLACQSVIGGNAIEHYIVRKTYEDGYEYASPYYYGKLDVLYYISDGNDQY